MKTCFDTCYLIAWHSFQPRHRFPRYQEASTLAHFHDFKRNVLVYVKGVHLGAAFRDHFIIRCTFCDGMPNLGSIPHLLPLPSSLHHPGLVSSFEISNVLSLLASWSTMQYLMRPSSTQTLIRGVLWVGRSGGRGGATCKVGAQERRRRRRIRMKNPLVTGLLAPTTAWLDKKPWTSLSLFRSPSGSPSKRTTIRGFNHCWNWVETESSPSIWVTTFASTTVQTPNSSKDLVAVVVLVVHLGITGGEGPSETICM